jgi:flagellar export protein FliJ
MSGFRFRLATVLDQRRREEDAAKRSLGKKIAASEALRGRIARMQETVRESKTGLRDALTGRVEAAQVGRLATHAQLTSLRGQRVVLELAAAERQVADAREALRRTIAARRAMELLEQRDRRAWQKRQAKAEQAELDDLASQRFARERLAEGVATC